MCWCFQAIDSSFVGLTVTARCYASQHTRQQEGLAHATGHTVHQGQSVLPSPPYTLPVNSAPRRLPQFGQVPMVAS